MNDVEIIEAAEINTGKIDGEEIIRSNTPDDMWNKYLNLSDRLKDVAKLYAEGNSRSNIAKKLGVTKGQVTQYFYNQNLKAVTECIKVTMADIFVEETALKKARTYIWALEELEKLYTTSKDFDEKFKALKELIKECKASEQAKPLQQTYIDKALNFQLPSVK